MSAVATKAIAEQRRTLPLAAVEWGWLVGSRRPLSSLSPEKQEQIRQAYDDTEWAVSDTDQDVGFIGFYTNHEIALQIASGLPGGFLVKLPVNGALPLKPGRYTTQEHPNSNDARRYEETSPGLARVEHVDRQALEKVYAQGEEQVCKLRALVEL